MSGKWVVETLLERTNLAGGLRLCVQRPSTIVRKGSDAVRDQEDFDWANTLIEYCHRIRAVPRF